MRRKNLLNRKSLFLVIIALNIVVSSQVYASIENLVNDYCRKENKLNGVGLVNTITEFTGPHSWISSACTGSLIKHKGVEFVLTAAHCVVDLEDKKVYPTTNMSFKAHHGCGTTYFESKVDKLYLSPGIQEYFIEHAIDMKPNHDWAILKLKDQSPTYIKKYQLEMSKKNYSNAANFGFGALQQSDGFPLDADGNTLLAYGQEVKRLIYEPMMLLSNYMIVGMSGGPVFDLNTFQVIGVNSHSRQKVLPSGGWVYKKASFASYPPIEQLEKILTQF